jgi:hypothetical protein
MARTGTVVALATAAVVAALPGAVRSGEEFVTGDVAIVGGARQLSTAEVRGADITDTERGRSVLREETSLDVNRRPHRVFAFGAQTVVIDTKSTMTVTEGLTRAGERVYDIVPQARPMPVAASPGYAVPPAAAWDYNTSGGFTTTLGTWKRTILWIIDVAWNWRACGGCQAHQYWRIYGKFQAATLTGARSDQGFKRAWLEFDNTGAWGGSPWEFELSQPEESVAGVANQTRSVGFSTNFDLDLGIPPFSFGGGADHTYGGSMTRSSENWHPVIRTEVASGGVQWCRFDAAEFTGTKTISTRVGLRQAVNAQLGAWNILYGMQDVTNSCPSQI